MFARAIYLSVAVPHQPAVEGAAATLQEDIRRSPANRAVSARVRASLF
jgi:hypothetical protein